MTTPRRKSLLQLIEQIEAEAKPSTVPQHRAAILRQRDEIADAIEKGNSLRIIWQALHGAGRVKMSYNYFRQLLISNKIWTPKKGTNKPVEETPATAQAAAEAAKKEEDDEPHFKIYRTTFLSNTNFGVADPYGKRKKPCDDTPAKELAAPKEGNSPVEEPAATTQAEAPKDDDEPHFKIYRSSFLADTYPNFGVADPYGKRKKPCDDKPAQEPVTPKEENKAAPSPAPQYEPKPECFIADAYPNFRATKRDDSDKE